jgi:hypothetical protein
LRFAPASPPPAAGWTTSLHADLASAQRAEQLAFRTSDWASIRQAQFIARGFRDKTFLPLVARGAGRRSAVAHVGSSEQSIITTE